MKFCAVGDIIIGRRIQKDFVGFEELAPIINQADAKFFNLETTLNYEGECYASPALLRDFGSHCAEFGTTLTRNEDGSYDCSWNK